MKLKPGEKGYTLIEVLVALSILATIGAALSMTITTMIRVTPATNNWAMALRQVQTAGHWISQDVKMSRGEIDIKPDANTFLVMIVPTWVSPYITNKEVTYQIETMATGQEWLTRSDNVTGVTMVVAQDIYLPSTTAIYTTEYCTENCTLTFTITAVRGNVIVSRDYEATQRVPPP